eukprot:74724-Rhodomonas_salina.1
MPVPPFAGPVIMQSLRVIQLTLVGKLSEVCLRQEEVKASWIPALLSAEELVILLTATGRHDHSDSDGAIVLNCQAGQVAEHQHVTPTRNVGQHSAVKHAGLKTRTRSRPGPCIL